MKFLNSLLLIFIISTRAAWASDGAASAAASSEPSIAPSECFACYWHYKEDGRVALKADIGGGFVVRTVEPEDLERILDLQMNAGVRRLFAGLPATRDETRERLLAAGFANASTKPAQAGMAIFSEDSLVGYARLGALAVGTSSPAIMLDPEFWRRGIATSLARSEGLAEALAEAHMIAAGAMKIAGAPEDVYPRFGFMGEPLSRHGATAHPENASFRILSRFMQRSPVPEGTAVIHLSSEGWIDALNQRFADSAADPLEKDRLYTVRVGAGDAMKEYTISFITEKFGQTYNALRGHFELPVSDHLKSVTGLDLATYIARRQSAGTSAVDEAAASE